MYPQYSRNKPRVANQLPRSSIRGEHPLSVPGSYQTQPKQLPNSCECSLSKSPKTWARQLYTSVRVGWILWWYLSLLRFDHQLNHR